MKSRWIIHPVLVGSFPILFLFAHNIALVDARELVLPLAIVLGATALLWLGLGWLVRDAHRAAMIVSLMLILFFSFSRWVTLVNKMFAGSDVVRNQRYVLAGSCLLLLVLGYLIVRKLRQPRRWTGVLNVCCAVLLVMPLLRGVSGLVKRSITPAFVSSTSDLGTDPSPIDARLPDIYYIMLDGHGRPDVLRDLFNYDAEPFVQHLRDKGFFVARRSVSNYLRTGLSLASALNCRYLDELNGSQHTSELPLRMLIQDNLVLKTLRGHGYRFVAYASGYELTDFQQQADSYRGRVVPGTQFQRMLLDTTPIWLIIGQQLDKAPYRRHRQRILYMFDDIPTLAHDARPMFVFAHVLSPHPPFVFDEDGRDVSPHERPYSTADGSSYQLFGFGSAEDYIDRYRRQIIFIDRQVERMVDRILANSTHPPIIIIHSDHGSRSRLRWDDLDSSDLHEAFCNLVAVLVPSPARAELYDEISPVNLFRVVMNHCFGTVLERLEDRCYTSAEATPYQFSDVTQRVRGRTPEAVSAHVPFFGPHPTRLTQRGEHRPCLTR